MNTKKISGPVYDREVKLTFSAAIMAIIIFIGCVKESEPEPQPPEQREIPTPVPTPRSPQVPSEIDISSLQKRIENFDTPLSYCEFIGMKDAGAISQLEADELIDYAYAHDNPILFRPAGETIPDTSYALNFLWISTAMVDENQPLTGGDRNRFNDHLVVPLKDWHNKQPKGSVNFWYDGNMLKDASKSIQVTKAQLADVGIDEAKVRFRNLRDIAIVKSHPNVFSANLPIYFRVDLAKAAIADHLLRIENLAYVATIDTDVAAITKEQFFDQRTLSALRTHGYIFGLAFTIGEENSFIILHNSSTFDLAMIHKKEVLDASIAIMEEKLREGAPINSQAVFYRYGYFRLAVKKIRGPWDKKLGLGKNMIIPKSRHGGGGYTEAQVAILKKALVGPEGCKTHR